MTTGENLYFLFLFFFSAFQFKIVGWRNTFPKSMAIYLLLWESSSPIILFFFFNFRKYINESVAETWALSHFGFEAHAAKSALYALHNSINWSRANFSKSMPLKNKKKRCIFFFINSPSHLYMLQPVAHVISCNLRL